MITPRRATRNVPLCGLIHYYACLLSFLAYNHAIFRSFRIAQHIVQISKIHPNGVFGLMVGIAFDGQLAADLPQREVVHQLVHALAGTGEPIVDGGDGIDHLAQNAGFLMHFAHGRLLRRFAFSICPFGRHHSKCPLRE